MWRRRQVKGRIRVFGPVMVSLIMMIEHSQADETVKLTPADFGYGYSITTSEEAALFEVVLPQEFYGKVTRPDLGDLRIFNGSGDVIPHALIGPDQSVVKELPSQPVSFFPLYGQRTDDISRQTIRIRTDPQGTLIDSWQGQDTKAAGEHVLAYLIDASPLENMPDKLELQWSAVPAQGFMTTLTVRGSDDLTDWQTLVEKVAIADLQLGQAVLQHRIIDLPPIRKKYLHISWPQELEALHLQAIRVHFSAEQVPGFQPVSLRTKGSRLNSDRGPIFSFDSGGFMQLNQVRLHSPLKSYMVQARLSSRNFPDQDWQTRWQGYLYRLEQGELGLENTPVALPGVVGRYWQLEVLNTENVLTGFEPVLEFNWVPLKVTFVPQGEQPYTIAFGSAGLKSAPEPLADLMSQLRQRNIPELIKTIPAGPMLTLGGSQKLQPGSPNFPWRKAVLWLTLIMGVLVLAGLVVHLYRQNRAETPA
ncbi:DUF3999 domain-containing protein [bacterium]|nr:DUF3999 domain-containing protein [bacterium]